MFLTPRLFKSSEYPAYSWLLQSIGLHVELLKDTLVKFCKLKSTMFARDPVLADRF